MTYVENYKRLGQAGWSAKQAFHAAKTAKRWEAVDGFTFDGDERAVNQAPGETVYNPGPVRLRVVWDDVSELGDLLGDTFDPEHNPDIKPALLAEERGYEIARIEREGVVGVIGEFWDGDAWEHADSCYGFVGTDWIDSGYDGDIMAATMEAYAASLATHARALEATRPDMYPLD